MLKLRSQHLLDTGNGAAHSLRLARDYEWLPETLAGLHFLAFHGLDVQKGLAAARGDR